MPDLFLNHYIEQFSRLRTDKNKKHWPVMTNYRAPHKPFLLLTILDLAAQAGLPTNFIEITAELGEIFSQYWQTIMPVETHGNIALPFFHLRSSGFWHLIPIPEKAGDLENIRQVDTLSQLKKYILGAKLDEELFELIKIGENRNILRTAIIQSYFDLSLHEILFKLGELNLKTFQYSQALIYKVKAGTPVSEDESEKFIFVRDQGFRKTVVKLYQHRCAFCGIRMLTVDGHSAVEAAHIIPWHVNHDDDPRNGVSLCRLCHWTFDEGLISISKEYLILLSGEIKSSQNAAGHLGTMEQRPMLRTKDSLFMPFQESIHYHRENVFRR
ncbi:MAG: HNH endonuclease [Chloroflexi bacterium HGW-Chloroflexi-10]|nr:MAG: HNH endonuclease [Chloroflexi bacterium HGW-Chloroflexi-10]